MKVMIEASARHVHLSEKDMQALFGASLTKVRNLSQPGQFLSKERLTIVGEKSEFRNVAILGPCRSKTQVEISLTDAIKLGVTPVIRESGDLEKTPGCKLVGPMGEVDLAQGVIVAKRHIHMHTKDAEKFNLKDGLEVGVKIDSDGRSLTFRDVVLRVSDKFSLAMHVDTDEANAFNYKPGMFGELFL